MYSLNILFPYLTRLNLRHFIPCHFHSLSEKNSGKKEKRLYLVMLKFDLINTRKIIRYSRSTINACSLLSHEW